MNVIEVRRTVGKRLKAARLKAVLTQRQLAARCGVSPGGISYLETGSVGASVEVLLRLARGLGIRVSALLRGLT